MLMRYFVFRICASFAGRGHLELSWSLFEVQDLSYYLKCYKQNYMQRRLTRLRLGKAVFFNIHSVVYRNLRMRFAAPELRRGIH